MDNATYDDSLYILTTLETPTGPLDVGSVIAGIILLLMVLITVTGNILTISAFVSNVLLRQKPSNLLLLSLSCSDLIVGATGLPVAAIHTGLGYWPLGKAACVLTGAFSVLGVSAGMYTITAVSLDRYFLVSREYPAYLNLQSSRNVKLTIGGAWTLAALISSCEAILWLAGDYSTVDYSKECLSPVRSDPRFIIIIFLLLFMIPFLVILISTLRFSVLLRRRLRSSFRPGRGSLDTAGNRRRRIREADNGPNVPPVSASVKMSSESPSDQETTELSSLPTSPHSPTSPDITKIEPKRPVKRKSLESWGRKKSFFGIGDPSLRSGSVTRATARRRYTKPAVRLAILLGAFAVCTLPYPIFLVFTKGSDCEDCTIRHIRNHLSNLLLSNSGLNPFLYAIMHRKIRQYFKMKLTGICRVKCYK